MHRTSYYCAGAQCRKTTKRLTVRMQDHTYFYCVDCGRRLELVEEVADVTPAVHAADSRRAG